MDKTVKWLTSPPIAIDTELIFLRTVIKLQEETFTKATISKVVEAQKLNVQPSTKSKEGGVAGVV